jgi:hypothetical protein
MSARSINNSPVCHQSLILPLTRGSAQIFILQIENCQRILLIEDTEVRTDVTQRQRLLAL